MPLAYLDADNQLHLDTITLFGLPHMQLSHAGVLMTHIHLFNLDQMVDPHLGYNVGTERRVAPKPNVQSLDLQVSMP